MAIDDAQVDETLEAQLDAYLSQLSGRPLGEQVEMLLSINAALFQAITGSAKAWRENAHDDDRDDDWIYQQEADDLERMARIAIGDDINFVQFVRTAHKGVLSARNERAAAIGELRAYKQEMAIALSFIEWLRNMFPGMIDLDRLKANWHSREKQREKVVEMVLELARHDPSFKRYGHLVSMAEEANRMPEMLFIGIKDQPAEEDAVP
jgi:hypothetical protein